MKVNPYESVEILQKLQKFYEEHSVEKFINDVPEKKLAIYLVQVKLDKKKGGGL